MTDYAASIEWHRNKINQLRRDLTRLRRLQREQQQQASRGMEQLVIVNGAAVEVEPWRVAANPPRERHAPQH